MEVRYGLAEEHECGTGLNMLLFFLSASSPL